MTLFLQRLYVELIQISILEKEYIDNWYTSFAAGAVLISIPIALLFLFMQKYYVDGISGAVKG